jgi:hypothetical protein
MKESELAKRFVDHLSDWDLYFEVPYDGIIDIVGVKKPIIAAFEVKTSFSLAVIDQAFSHRGKFHYSYVCVPTTNRLAEKICRDYGIGVLMQVASNGVIHEVVKPKQYRNAKFNCDKLKPYQKESVPGSQSERITAFGYMILSIKNYLLRHPGATYKQVFDDNTSNLSY